METQLSDLAKEINAAKAQVEDEKLNPGREKQKRLNGFTAYLVKAIEALGHKCSVTQNNRLTCGAVNQIAFVDEYHIAWNLEEETGGYYRDLKPTGRWKIKVEFDWGIKYAISSHTTRADGHFGYSIIAQKISAAVRERQHDAKLKKEAQEKAKTAEKIREDLIAGYKHHGYIFLEGGPEDFHLKLTCLKAQHVAELLAFAESLGMLHKGKF